MINKLKHNTRIKIFALLSAIVLWLYVMTVVDPVIVQSYRDVPVSITNVEDIKSKKLSIYSSSNLSTDIYIKGRMSSLKRIKKSHIYIYGRVEQPREGKNVVDLKADLPGGATYQLNPQIVTVDLEKEISINKRIEVNLEGKLANEVGNIETSKNDTNVYGPRSLIKKVDKVIGTLNVDIEKEEYSSNVTLKAVDKYGKIVENVEIEDKFIVVNATLLKSKQVPVNIKFEGELPNGYKLKEYNFDDQTIQIRGNDHDLAKVEVVNTYPINLNSVDRDTTVNINLQLPKGIISNVKSIPVKIDISKSASDIFEISKGSILFINNNKNIDTSRNNLPDKIKVNITFADEVGDISNDDIKLYVDLSDNSLGDNRYKIRYDIPYEINEISIQPENVTIAE